MAKAGNPILRELVKLLNNDTKSKRAKGFKLGSKERKSGNPIQRHLKSMKKK